ncbi:MAG: hypothetical protein DMF06_08670 [Verrucomicrobia bacterium]|nr:MAG: hypothetical protein DMF06_08670 [Verrucomicrobiota bacterium]
MNSKLSQLKALLDGIAELFPGASVAVSVSPSYRSVTIHGVECYQHATEIMRLLGIGERGKQIIQADHIWVNVFGEAGGLTVNVFCTELPPCCRLEKETVRIPKTEVVASNSEFVEVERTKVVCGNGGVE